MGRVRNAFVKRNTREIMNQFADKFTTEFEKNKKILTDVAKINSKKIRNRIAGYITFLKKKGISLKVVE